MKCTLRLAEDIAQVTPQTQTLPSQKGLVNNDQRYSRESNTDKKERGRERERERETEREREKERETEYIKD